MSSAARSPGPSRRTAARTDGPRRPDRAGGPSVGAAAAGQPVASRDPIAAGAAALPSGGGPATAIAAAPPSASPRSRPGGGSRPADSPRTPPSSPGDSLSPVTGPGYPEADLSNYRDEVALWRSVPMELVRRFRFVPLAEDGERLAVAVAPPVREEETDRLEWLLARPLTVHTAAAAEIEAIIERNTNSSFLLDRASEDLRIERLAGEGPGAGPPVISLESLDQPASGSPVVRLVDSLLVNALERRATDIHIETRAEEVILKYRVDGVLYPAMEAVSSAFHATIAARLKVMAELDVAERRVPQDGRFRAMVPGAAGEAPRTVDFRVSVMPSVHGEDVVIRVLDKRGLGSRLRELSLEALGFAGRELEVIREHTRRPFGMFLVTGPTGSGKTTTLYAALSEIASSEAKIVSIEDPVEYEIAGVTQVPVNEKKGLTFARGLRSILRHDPDTIMVGEVRDPETASIAVQAALTGHLVLTTVHANHAFDVIGRFLHMGSDPHNFVSALHCIAAQRLLRLLCPGCRAGERPEAAEREMLAASGFSPEVVFRPGGCRKCEGNGFRGRTAVSEVLPLSPAVREMILARRGGPQIREQAEREGMTSLRKNALAAVAAGRTTLAEANRVTSREF